VENGPKIFQNTALLDLMTQVAVSIFIIKLVYSSELVWSDFKQCPHPAAILAGAVSLLDI
jgi:hypothetical protein